MRFFFALLALAANAATIGIVAVAIAGRFGSGGAEFRDRTFGAVRGLELWVAFVVAATATIGSLYLSEIVHLVCPVASECSNSSRCLDDPGSP